MAEVFLCGGELSAPIELTIGAKFPRWPAASALLTPSAASGAVTQLGLQAAANAVLADATHLSLHTADPGATGAEEIAEMRTAASLAYATGSIRVTAQTDGAVSTSTVTATHWGAWKVT